MAESDGNEVAPADQIIVSRDSGRVRAALALCVMDRLLATVPAITDPLGARQLHGLKRRTVRAK